MPFDYPEPVIGGASRRLGRACARRGLHDQAQAAARRQPSVEVGPPLKSDAWKQVATAADKDRIARLGLAWQEALAEAQQDQRRATSARKASCSCRAPPCRGPAPTPGSYNCRLIKLGKATAQEQAVRELQAVLLLRRGRGRPADHRQADRQPAAGRPVVGGRRPDRLMFLGSLALGDEQQPLAYGDDPKRDMAGVLERIAPFKWRLVIPWPQSTSKLDVFELTPVDRPAAAG